MVVSVSQAISAEIDLAALVERILTVAAEIAGALRASLILPRDGELFVEAEAVAVENRIECRLARAVVDATSAPESILRYVARTGEPVIVGDALKSSSQFSHDPYVRAARVRSLLCLPLLKQTRLVGILFLQNDLVPNAFTEARAALLEVLASQAAISLENARLHADLRSAQERLSGAVRENELMIDVIPTVAWRAQCNGYVEHFNKPWLEYTGMTREDASGWGWAGAIHPDDVSSVGDYWQVLVTTDRTGEIEGRLRRHDGVYRWHLFRARPLRNESGQIVSWYGTGADIEDLRQAQEALNRTRSELAEMTKVASLGALAASIAHEINQPLAGIMTNTNTCERMLTADPPNVSGARETVRRALRDTKRAADVIARLRALFAKKQTAAELVDLSEATREVLAMSINELRRNRIVMRSELTCDLPRVTGDRIQLQQVIVNLLVNALEAMSGIDDRPRHLLIRTVRDADERVSLTVRDVGVGIRADQVDQLFDAFHTTKQSSMGIGLSVSRSIIEHHGGRLSGTPNHDGPGATFSFSLPVSGGSDAANECADG
jgi:PAS domain S-box-containing protein